MPVLSYISPVVKIAVIVNYGLLFRFVQLQVQLKAAEENSKIIMSAIQKSKRIEIFLYIDLVIYALTILLSNIANKAIKNLVIWNKLTTISNNIAAVT